MLAKTIWKLKKYNGLIVVTLMMIQAHSVFNVYLTDGALTYLQIKEIYSQWWVKLFALLFHGSIAMHLFTAADAMSVLFTQKETIRKTVQKAIATIALLFFLIPSTVVVLI